MNQAIKNLEQNRVIRLRKSNAIDWRDHLHLTIDYYNGKKGDPNSEYVKETFRFKEEKEINYVIEKIFEYMRTLNIECFSNIIASTYNHIVMFRITYLDENGVEWDILLT